MTVRAIDQNNDWTFGKGKNNYKFGVAEIAQNIKTRLQSFLGDCFFETNAGIDWFNLLGSKSVLKLRLQVSAVILNTKDVDEVIEVSFEAIEKRKLVIQYKVNTILGPIQSQASIEV
tara:strand:- start:19761 stop:20111 length:351 start_codon:yes stop_codon:yes gene_type:complete